MLKEKGPLQGVRVPWESWPLDNGIAGFENALTLDGELEGRLKALLPRDNPNCNNDQFITSSTNSSSQSLHEAKFLPRGAGAALHDGDGLHNDLGTFVLRKQ